LALLLARAGASRTAVRTVRMMASRPEISEHDKFFFDLNGFLVVRNVFTPEEVAAANAAIDAHSAQLRSREAAALRNAKDGTPMSAKGPRKDMGGMLWWEQPHCDVFRQVLVHPRLVPYYTALCGDGFRLDHQPLVIAQSSNSEGFALHGGPISGADGVPAGQFNPELQYRCVGGQMWTTLLAASVQLCDHAPGDGGFAIVRGSHKLNLPVPDDVANGLGGISEHLFQPTTKAGDVVLWSEATVHGATPWRAAHERRIALYRFAPANMGYGRGYLSHPPEGVASMTPAQRAVVEPPYAARLERPVLAHADGGAQPAVRPIRRATAKKEFDRQLFGTDYF